MAGLRALAQVGDPREDVRAGLLSEAQAEAITGLYGRAAADRVIIERALALEARLRMLAGLGTRAGPRCRRAGCAWWRWTPRPAWPAAPGHSAAT